ncbi:TPA: flavin reductase [Candidatus Galligastranaerophilus gallistercoris]|nr:flavin reductase [Candidatus Galligastranaerophilus gallistercoris]
MLNKNVLWDFTYGVYVVSSFDGDKPTGCIANSVAQVTNTKIMVSINHSNHTNSVIKKDGYFSVSILSEKSDPNIISVFGFTSGADTDKFQKIKYETKNNLPVVYDSIGYIILKTTDVIELDTHSVFIGEIMDGDILRDGVPMTYKYYHDVIKGRAPKSAPTYIEEEVKPQTGVQYRCKICGYIYNGDITKEPPNYVCPVCKQPKSVFERIIAV